jgi:hypothetical protein
MRVDFLVLGERFEDSQFRFGGSNYSRKELLFEISIPWLPWIFLFATQAPKRSSLKKWCPKSKCA